jgi:hypothetical protein
MLSSENEMQELKEGGLWKAGFVKRCLLFKKMFPEASQQAFSLQFTLEFSEYP